MTLSLPRHGGRGWGAAARGHRARQVLVLGARKRRAMTCLENFALLRAYPDAYADEPGHDVLGESRTLRALVSDQVLSDSATPIYLN
jgi:hypothetical protein